MGAARQRAPARGPGALPDLQEGLVALRELAACAHLPETALALFDGVETELVGVSEFAADRLRA